MASFRLSLRGLRGVLLLPVLLLVLGFLGAVTACGGNDKPPLTPDNTDGSLDPADASTPPAVAPAPPTIPAPLPPK